MMSKVFLLTVLVGCSTVVTSEKIKNPLLSFKFNVPLSWTYKSGFNRTADQWISKGMAIFQMKGDVKSAVSLNPFSVTLKLQVNKAMKKGLYNVELHGYTPSQEVTVSEDNIVGTFVAHDHMIVGYRVAIDHVVSYVQSLSFRILNSPTLERSQWLDAARTIKTALTQKHVGFASDIKVEA